MSGQPYSMIATEPLTLTNLQRDKGGAVKFGIVNHHYATKQTTGDTPFAR